MPEKPLIGFIGQGYVGKNYADDFERRGFETVRYALEEPYRANKSRIKDCDLVFIAVPTPTTTQGFDAAIVREGLSLVGSGKVGIIKSTIMPGTGAALQADFPDILLFYSPEFLSEATAAYDAAHPFSNIIGITADDEAHREAAARIHAVLAPAPYALTCTSTEAEFIKYSHNGAGFVNVVFFNLMYDLAAKLGANWDVVRGALQADKYVAHQYTNPVHKTGRGAGGHCFIKDFAALRGLYESEVEDPAGIAALTALEKKNITLLKQSGKDLDLLRGVYSDNI